MNSNKVILIVDDELIILESLRIQISRILPDLVLLEAASSGDEAIQLIDEFYNENKDLVLVISDFNLDDLKGTDILKHAISKFSTVEKVILSGQSNNELIQQFNNEYGLAAVIDKPWNFGEIQEIILPLIS
jgi:YesN/AraC family two-component response regulator